MTKTSWQTGNLKINEELGNPSRTCFVRGWKLDETRRGANCRQPTSVCSPIIHETLDHNNTTTCQNIVSSHKLIDGLSTGTRNLLNFTLNAAVSAQLFPFDLNNLSVVGGRSTHSLPALEAELPLLDELGRLPFCQWLQSWMSDPGFCSAHPRSPTCSASSASCSCATLAMVTSKSTYSFARASSASTDF